MTITVLELINLLEAMPDNVDVVVPIPGGHADLFAVMYDPEHDVCMLMPE
jgi:hypothetical protein